jgi:hypothetical protein
VRPSPLLMADLPVRIVGLDCACRAHSVGLALATRANGRVTIDSIAVGRGDRSMREAFASDIRAAIAQVPLALVALDAPLGWPEPLAHALAAHRAGDRVGDLGDADRYVSRTTDAVVYEHVKTWPLDVGADLIARTAIAALELIAALRDGGRGLPLVWKQGPLAHTGAIEVYPKATFLARQVAVKDYKSKKREVSGPARRLLLEALARELTIAQEHHELILGSDHALDAVGCVLAAKDFLDGVAVFPNAEQSTLANREGWIWFRQPLPNP